MWDIGWLNGCVPAFVCVCDWRLFLNVIDEQSEEKYEALGTEFKRCGWIQARLNMVVNYNILYCMKPTYM